MHLLRLLEVLSKCREEAAVLVDFQHLRRITPAGLVLLATWVSDRAHQCISTTLVNIECCTIKGYLQRMDLFRNCGVDGLEEGFKRHDASKRFVPLREIPSNTDDLAAELAD